MDNLIEGLAQVREMQGKPPLPSPHIIQGFGDGSDPAPPYVPGQREVDSPGGIVVEDEFLDGGPPEAPAFPSSPLVPPTRVATREMLPRNPATVASGGTFAPAPAPAFSLTVLDEVAGWKGREVKLSEEEQKAIRLVVLRAIQRELDADLRPLVRRRSRKPRQASEPVSVEPRKRGRPRKVTP